MEINKTKIARCADSKDFFFLLSLSLSLSAIALGKSSRWHQCLHRANVVLILLYGCTTWVLTKCMEKKLGGNYTRMLQAILNKSWRQHPTKQQLYGHLPPITKTIQVRQTRHAGYY